MADTARAELDAIELLLQDHREIEGLFRDFEHLKRGGEDTTAVIESACTELKLHDALENEIFYPAVSDAAGDDAMETLLVRAEDDHDTVLELIDELDDLGADTERRNACFTRICDHAQRHVALEETELLPKVRTLGNLDLVDLAAEMIARKSELIDETALAEAA